MLDNTPNPLKARGPPAFPSLSLVNSVSHAFALPPGKRFPLTERDSRHMSEAGETVIASHRVAMEPLALPRCESIRWPSIKEFCVDYLPLIISLVSGAVGGNAAAAVLKKLNLGTLGNSLAGILGGGLGGQLLGMLGIAAGGGEGSLDLSNIVGSIASGGVGGGVLLAIVGTIKNVLSGGKGTPKA